ncbi:hypothetical protein SAMN05428963_11221 [Consotaella salsifontis]|uniref:Uncharacterized protein n=1 Tax=Consotaella salsifontis TaxID=1365950 RepID=A0A1T4SMA8_9HYPH|nr:hypothetical protein SAMN05428963_11221 [Consotaella salsifontis]
MGAARGTGRGCAEPGHVVAQTSEVGGGNGMS